MSILKTFSFAENVIISDAIGTPGAPGAYFGFANALGTVVASTGPRFQAVNATPNGTLTSPIGSLCIDTVTGILYRNTDGATAWQVVSSGSAVVVPTYLVYDSGYLGAPAASIDTGVFAMPTGTAHLSFALVSRASGATTYEHLNLTLNADAVAANYLSIRSLGDPAVGVLTSPIERTAASQIIGSTPAASASANKFGILQGRLNFNSSTQRRLVTALSADARTAAGEEYIGEAAVEWANGAVVTQMAFSAVAGNLIAGSRLMVYAQ